LSLRGGGRLVMGWQDLVAIGIVFLVVAFGTARMLSRKRPSRGCAGCTNCVLQPFDSAPPSCDSAARPQSPEGYRISRISASASVFER
jgi:hypothetical protein